MTAEDYGNLMDNMAYCDKAALKRGDEIDNAGIDFQVGHQSKD